MKHSIFALIALFVIATLACSCFKEHPIKPGVQTTVKGKFFDSTNNLGVAGIKIKIAEYEQEGYIFVFNYKDPRFIKYIDSAVTDNDGNYSINFQTTGNGNRYYVQFEPISPHYMLVKNGNSYSTNFFIGPEQLHIGSRAEYSFNLVRYYIAKLKLNIHDNPSPPLFINFSDMKVFSTGANVAGKNIDTTVNLIVYKKSNSYDLQFSIEKDKMMYRSDHIPVNLALDKDTANAGEYIVYPLTFKQQ